MNINIKAVIASLLLCALLPLQVASAHTSGFARNYQNYPPIENQGINAFVERGLDLAIELFGKPGADVTSIELRFSHPLRRDSKLPRGFAGTSLRDEKQGIYTIFLSRKPGNRAFHGQLAHEIAHLINPSLYDVYVEGLNTLFAKKLLAKEGLSWSTWEKHFNSGRDPFYGESYQLMKELEEITGEKRLATLLKYTVPSNRSGSRQHIDIDRWLATLEFTQRNQATQVILARADKMERARKKSRPLYTFQQPQAPFDLTIKLAKNSG